jgi:hypothetical protein
LRKIEFVRLSLSGLTDSTKTARLQIAKMEFASNQWRFAGIYPRDTLSSTPGEMSISVANTQENKDYLPPPTVNVEVDPTTQVHLQEQSLALQFSNLKPGQKAIAKRVLAENLNLSTYGRILMEIYGGQDFGEHFTYFIRLAKDSLNYYEYQTHVKEGWSPQSRMNIVLQDFASIKQTYLKDHPDKSICDTLTPSGIRIYGNPQLTGIGELYMGVYVDSQYPDIEGVTGKIWVDDLKLTEVKAEPGWAGRVAFNTQFADFLSINGGTRYQDGNFVQLSQSNRVGSNIAQLDGNLNGNLSVNKFLPAEWGLSIPLSASMQGSLTRPRYEPSKDLELSQDGLKQMATEAVNEIAGMDVLENPETPSKDFQTKKVDKNIGVSYSKGTRSENPVVDFTADRTTTNYGYNSSSFSDPTGLDSSWNHTGNLQYDLSPREPLRFTPFKKIKLSYFPSFLKEFYLNPLPTQVSFGLAKAKYNQQKHMDKRNQSVRNSEELGLGHDMRISYAPFNNFTTNYNVSMERRFDDQIQGMKEKGVEEVSAQVFALDPIWGENLILNRERSRTQNFDTEWNPSFVSWLTNRLGYKADYRHQLLSYNQYQQTANNARDSLDVDVDAKSQINVSFMPVSFFEQAAQITKAITPLNIGMETIKKGFSALSLSRIGANYSVGVSQTTKRLGVLPLSPWELFKYQLGVWNRTPEEIFFTGAVDENSFGQSEYWRKNNYDSHVEDRRAVQRAFDTDTDIDLPFSTRLGLNARWTKNINNYVATNKPSDSTIVFPDWGLQGSNSYLSRLKFFRDKTKSLNLNSAYNYKKEIYYQSMIKETEENRFEPILGANIRWKNDMTTDIQRKQSTRVEKADANEITSSEVGDSVSLGYSISKEKGFKFLKWKKKFQSNMDIFFGLGHSTQIRIRKQENAQDPITEEDNENYNGGPGMRYHFTSKIDGGADFNYSWTRNRAQANIVKKSILVRIWAEINF